MNIKQRAKEILDTLTLDEKLGQLNLLFIRHHNIAEMKQMIRDGGAGAVIIAEGAFAGDGDSSLYRPNIDELQRTSVEESDKKIPLLFGRDIIHGHKIVFPIPLAMSASFNFELIKEAYRHTAQEALCDGINWTYTPMLDTSRDPRWGRVIEGAGEDPYLGSKLAEAVVKGVQGESYPYKMAACAKHYIGYGASEGGRDYHRCEISDYSLRNFYTKAFKSAAKADVLSVMSSFNEINGTPTTSSKYYLTDILRDELGFDGFVVSDWGAVYQLIRQGVARDKKEAAELSINAGLDMEMTISCFSYLKELLDEGKVTYDRIDEAVLHILEAKLKLGLFENPYPEYDTFDEKLHLDTAKKLSDECAVLLKNKDNILPLDKNAVVGICGPYAEEKRDLLGSWALDFDLDYVTSIKDAVMDIAPNSVFVPEYKQRDMNDLDTVIVALGEHAGVTGEAHSVANIALDYEQALLVKKLKRLGKKVIAVISAGRPLDLSEIENEADAILYVWHAGTQTALSTADLLFGNKVPSGRLPMTFPRATGQVPIFYNCPPSGRDCDGYYSDTQTISNYEDILSTPLYPFGYGLSYTEFSYSNITVDKNTFTEDDLKQGIKVSVTVSNIGNYDAKEVVQVYVRDIKSSYTRPIKELKAAKKIYIESTKSTQVEFYLDEEAFGYFNPKGEFIIEKGEFDIFIGHDSYTQNKITISLI